MNGCIYRTEDNKCKFLSDYGKGIVSYCYHCDCKEKTVTNADRLRAMSDEELGVLLAEVETGVDVKACNRDIYDHWLSWLKSPVEEGKG